MSVLVIAEHDNATLKAATRNAVAAAAEIDADVHVLVAGQGCGPAAEAAAQVAGVAKVLVAEDASYEHALAENVAKLVVDLSGGYSHVLAPATAPSCGRSMPATPWRRCSPATRSSSSPCA